MHLWQTMLQFGDAHPWFLPSIGAVVVLITAAYKSSSWIRRMITAAWHIHEDNRVLNYLATQIDTSLREPNAYGVIPPWQRHCNTIKIAEAIGQKPVKVRAILERLKPQHRVDQVGQLDLWSISEYELAARTRRKWKFWKPQRTG